MSEVHKIRILKSRDASKVSHKVVSMFDTYLGAR